MHEGVVKGTTLFMGTSQNRTLRVSRVTPTERNRAQKKRKTTRRIKREIFVSRPDNSNVIGVGTEAPEVASSNFIES